MKKVFKYILWVVGIIAAIFIGQVVLGLILILIYAGLSRNPKMGGRDTVLSLGDGTYQVFTVPDPATEDNHTWQFLYILENVITSENLIEGISSYKLMERENTVYFMGHQRENGIEYEYFILNYKTGTFKRASKLSELNNKEQKVFNNKQGFEVLEKQRR